MIRPWTDVAHKCQIHSSAKVTKPATLAKATDRARAYYDNKKYSEECSRDPWFQPPKSALSFNIFVQPRATYRAVRHKRVIR